MNPRSLNGVVTVMVVGVVWTTGPRVLVGVYGPDGDGHGRRFVWWTSGSLVGRPG